MKKLLLLIAAAVPFAFTSCDVKVTEADSHAKVSQDVTAYMESSFKKMMALESADSIKEFEESLPDQLAKLKDIRNRLNNLEAPSEEEKKAFKTALEAKEKALMEGAGENGMKMMGIMMKLAENKDLKMIETVMEEISLKYVIEKNKADENAIDLEALKGLMEAK